MCWACGVAASTEHKSGVNNPYLTLECVVTPLPAMEEGMFCSSGGRCVSSSPWPRGVFSTGSTPAGTGDGSPLPPRHGWNSWGWLMCSRALLQGKGSKTLEAKAPEI